ncbi:hypothetical protein [Nitrososphaera sp.]|uniref:hypothetical protein n=1 Tax=Nitrososphaera sp. TaxID=1971748 RepID=UPI00307D51B9
MRTGAKIAVLAGIAISGLAGMLLLLFTPTVFSFYGGQQNVNPPPALTSMNQSLEPRSTLALNHPAWRGQVMEVRIEPNLGSTQPIPEYELLITMVDPGGYTVFSKFIKEPFVQKFIPAREGWHAIIITNVGNTTIASGDRIGSRMRDPSADKDVPIAIPCIVPPSLKNPGNTPWPWC